MLSIAGIFWLRYSPDIVLGMMKFAGIFWVCQNLFIYLFYFIFILFCFVFFFLGGGFRAAAEPLQQAKSEYPPRTHTHTH